MIVDPPSPTASLAEWEQHLASLKSITKVAPDDAEELLDAILLAEAMVMKIMIEGSSI